MEQLPEKHWSSWEEERTPTQSELIEVYAGGKTTYEKPLQRIKEMYQVQRKPTLDELKCAMNNADTRCYGELNDTVDIESSRSWRM